jgi:hypothetical protein
MTKKTFVTSLPIFNATRPLTAALGDPGIAAWGAVISKHGAQYRVHSLDDISAARSKFGGSATFARLEGRVLQPFTEADTYKVRVALDAPRDQITDATVRAFESSLGITLRYGERTGGAMAHIVTDSGNSYILVGVRYRCPRDNRMYSETVYIKNDGKCPVHPSVMLESA